jgi:hypothetical protein
MRSAQKKKERTVRLLLEALRQAEEDNASGGSRTGSQPDAAFLKRKVAVFQKQR